MNLLSALRAKALVRNLRCTNCGEVIEPEREVREPHFRFCSEACAADFEECRNSG